MRPAFHILSFLFAALAFSVQAKDKAPAPVDAGPYVPSPSSVVADMLTLAEVGPKDFVIDLGSGDGRIVLTAAKVFGARGFGVDINEKLVKEANESARQQGIADRAKFTIQDLFKADISKATVVTMYLLPKTVNMLKEKLLKDLRPGTRILSHDYPLDGWEADDFRQFDLDDKVAVTGVTTTLIYMYLVPAKAEGNWSVKLPAALGKEPSRLNIKQTRVTRISGGATIDGKEFPMENPKLRGERLTFRLFVSGKPYDFAGMVRGQQIDGTVEGSGIKGVWSAAAAK